MTKLDEITTMNTKTMRYPQLNNFSKLPMNWSRPFSAAFVLWCLATLLLPTPARAAITLLDGPVGVTNSPTTSTNISMPFTVTSGAGVMAVTLLEKDSSSTPVAPATLSWNGQTLTRVVDTIDTASTYREAAIYYLFNPTTDGLSHNITNSLKPTSVTVTLLQAFTLNGVDTTVAPLTGSANSTSGNSILSFTIPSVAAGSWAAVGGILGSTVPAGSAVSGTGGTTVISTTNAASNTAFSMGYISGLSAGSDTFSYSWTLPPSPNPTANAFVAAVFTPFIAASPATVSANPTSTSVYPTQTAQFSAAVSGTTPITNLWQFNGTNLADGTQGDGSVISGSGTTTLTISNVTTGEAGSYVLTTTNAYGGTNSTPAVLTVLAFNAATNFTMTTFEGAGSDWNTTGVWNDGLGGQSAKLDAFEFPGSSFEVLTNALLRTPTAASYNTFPGV
jgi:hypothetical protein